MYMQSLAYLYMGVIVPASVVVPVVFAIVKFSDLNKPLTTIFFYLLFAGMVNACAALLAFRQINNLPLLHVYTIAEFLFLALFFYQVTGSPGMKKGVLAGMLLFPLYGFINFTFIQSLQVFNSYTRPVEAILLIMGSLAFFYMQSLKNQNSSWQAQPETWIVIGILVYFSSSLVQFSFSNVVSSHAGRNVKLLIWTIHATLVLIMYVLFAVGFAKCRE